MGDEEEESENERKPPLMTNLRKEIGGKEVEGRRESDNEKRMREKLVILIFNHNHQIITIHFDPTVHNDFYLLPLVWF